MSQSIYESSLHPTTKWNRTLIILSYFFSAVNVAVLLHLDRHQNSASHFPRPMASESRQVDLTGLAQKWDESPEIRQRLRNGGSLLHPSSKDKVLIRTAALNGPVLQPVCEMMAKLQAVMDDGKIAPSPAVEALREEVQALMGMAKQDVTFQEIDKAAWSVRKYIAFLKLKIRKREVSTEAFQ